MLIPDLTDSLTSPLRPRLTCADGTTLSVQASSYHYCTPRNDVGPYTHVEVGYPSVLPSWWDEYADPSGDVAGWVPVQLVEEFITEHGSLS